jgi:predicted nucleic acid-binding protein
VYERPAPIDRAWGQVEAWLACPPVWIPQAGEHHPQLLGNLLKGLGGGANLITDAHLAGLAIEHGLTLFSTDGDFARFPGLKWENPLPRLPRTGTTP